MGGTPALGYPCLGWVVGVTPGQGWGTPHPDLNGKVPQPSPDGVYPRVCPPAGGTPRRDLNGQYPIRRGRYAFCVHAGLLSCYVVKICNIFLAGPGMGKTSSMAKFALDWDPG